jgi:uncharacterized integral membrane protein
VAPEVKNTAAQKNGGEVMIYVSMIVSFLILLCLVVAGVQNSTPLEVKVGWWTFQMSLPSVVFWAAAGGAAVVAVLSLPKLARKVLQTRRLHKEVARLEGLCKEPRRQENA